MSLRAFKTTGRERDEMSNRSFCGTHAGTLPGRRACEAVVGPAPLTQQLGPPRFHQKGDVMARSVIAISVVTATVLVTAFGLTMAVSYSVNERCTDQMAQQGNC